MLHHLGGLGAHPHERRAKRGQQLLEDGPRRGGSGADDDPGGFFEGLDGLAEPQVFR